ncbi:MAG: TolC family protein [Bryobacterales bacterium]|nr:TolC family protein [Bryobacterales bacterium]
MKILASLMLAGALLPAQQKTLTLREAEEIALRNHPRIRAAELRAQAAGEAVTEARSSLYPQFGASLTAVHAQELTRITAGTLQDSSLSSRVAGGVTLSQLLTDFGRTGKLAASEESRMRSLKEETAFNRARVRLHVREFFYKGLMAQAVLESARKNLEMRQLTARQIGKLAESNLRSSLDVSFAEVNVSEAELLVVRAENEIAAALSELSAAMGQAEAETYALQGESQVGPPEISSEPLVRKAREQRPDLASLRLRRDSAARFADAERRLKFPAVQALGVTGLLPFAERRLPNSYGGFGLNVNIPIFNGKLFQARHAEAVLKSEAISQETRELEVKVANMVRIAWLNEQTAWRRLTVTRRLAEQAQRTLRLAQTRHDLGLGSIIELSQAQLNRTNAEIADASARYDYQWRTAVVEYETGVLR